MRISQSLKFERWFSLYIGFVPNYKECYRNATQSAIIAYNLDPKIQYDHASVLGHRNLIKAKYLAADFFERKGITFGVMIDILISMMINSENFKIWFYVIEIMGYRDSLFKKAL